MWETLIAELAPHGLNAVAVSLDDDVGAARPWHDEAGLTFPSVIDVQHRIAELFGVVNVPSTVWFDETGAMVRPPTIAPGDDRFREFSGIDSSIHHDALRRWVVDGERIDPELMRRWAQPPADDAGSARAHRRIAAFLHRRGDDEAARAHFDTASALAPNDWTIRRGQMPLLGGDPFGQEFFDFVGEWIEGGSSSYAE